MSWIRLHSVPLVLAVVLVVVILAVVMSALFRPKGSLSARQFVERLEVPSDSSGEGLIRDRRLMPYFYGAARLTPDELRRLLYFPCRSEATEDERSLIVRIFSMSPIAEQVVVEFLPDLVEKESCPHRDQAIATIKDFLTGRDWAYSDAFAADLLEMPEHAARLFQERSRRLK